METRGYRSPRKARPVEKGEVCTSSNSTMVPRKCRLHLCPKALTELEASEDRELMQPLESRLAELKSRLHGARPMGQQVDGLRGVISRCQKRLAEAETAKADAEAAILKETEDIANYRAQLAELEPLLTTPMGFRKADEPNNGVVINSQTHVGKQQHRQRGCGAIASWIDGTSSPAYTARRTADWTRRTA